jgi:hypothetical protein
MIARSAASARGASVRLSDRNARFGRFVAFGNIEYEVDRQTDGQWRIREELIERVP